MITYIHGDATCPLGSGVKIIAHVVNDLGGWGKGFVLALSKRWKEPEQAYRGWIREKNFTLGEVQFVPVGKYIYVANMLCQHGLRGRSNPIPLRYNALEECLKRVAQTADRLKASVHMPRIGCGLGGAKWEKIELLIANELDVKNISVTVYDFE